MSSKAAADDSLSRDERIVQLRAEGATLEEIGEGVGVTRERVRQIVAKLGGPTREEARAANRRRTTQALRELLLRDGPSSPHDAAKILRISHIEAVACWPSELEHFKMRRTAVTTQVWSDEEIVAAIREAALYEFPLTLGTYDDLVRSGQVVGPSLPRVVQRMGSWSAACDHAGVEGGRQRRESYQSQWTQADMLGYVRDFLSDPRTQHTAAHFDAWRRNCSPSAPSLTTLRYRIGTWSEIKRQALAKEVG